MATRRCPRCKLINPGTTIACDCGWSFAERRVGAPRQRSAHEIELARQRDLQARAARRLAIGVVMLLLGIALLVVDIVRRVAPADARIILAVRGAGIGLAVAGVFNVLHAIVTLAWGGAGPSEPSSADRG
jgi:hypothetical protein